MAVDGAELYPLAHQFLTRESGLETFVEMFGCVAWWVPFCEYFCPNVTGASDPVSRRAWFTHAEFVWLQRSGGLVVVC